MDLKFALRSIRRTPGFALLSILILALGIGANTAIFSVVHGVVLRPLEYRHPEQLVSISMTWPGGFEYGQVSGPDFLDFQSQSKAFQSMAAYDDELVSVVANQRPEFAGVAVVSAGFLRTLQVVPAAGRAFSPADFRPAPVVAMVSQGFWRRHFGSTPFSSGHLLKVAGKQLEIIGVLPGGFHFPEAGQTDVWAPVFSTLQDENRGAHNYHVVGRLKLAVSVKQAQAQVSAIAARLEKAYPGTNKTSGAYVTSLTNFTVRQVKTSLYILLAAVALVLLIACANIANLLLARGTGRLRELAIRAAIGASQARIVRQLFTETLMLAGAGAIAGGVLAWFLLPLLIAVAPSFVPRLNEVRIDWTVLFFCAGAGLLSSVLFGLIPAMQVSRVDPNRDLRGGGSRGVVGKGTRRLRHAFITVEIALCMTLLVSAGLLLRSFEAMTSIDMGFHPANLLVAHVSVPSGDKVSIARSVFIPMLERVQADQRVQAAAILRGLPGDPEGRSTVAYIVTGQTEMTVNSPQAGVSVVSGSYFQTLGTPLRAGRTFSDRDNPEAPLVVVVNEALVRRSYPRQNPLGQKVMSGFDDIHPKWMTIVGVVADARLDGPKQVPMPEMYMPYRQHPDPDSNIVVKTRGNPLAMAEPVRRLAESLDSEATVKLTTMESHMADTVATPRFSSALVAVFAGLAVLLAAIGIYAVISYSVTQRTAEIGLRMALGADRTNVIYMVLREALRLTGLGLLTGSLAAIAAGRLLQSQLFEVSPADPSLYAIMLVALTVVAVTAAWLPAWRASRVEPLAALRQE